jgi:hypothetical protein
MSPRLIDASQNPCLFIKSIKIKTNKKFTSALPLPKSVASSWTLADPTSVQQVQPLFQTAHPVHLLCTTHWGARASPDPSDTLLPAFTLLTAAAWEATHKASKVSSILAIYDPEALPHCLYFLQSKWWLTPERITAGWDCTSSSCPKTRPLEHTTLAQPLEEPPWILLSCCLRLCGLLSESDKLRRDHTEITSTRSNTLMTQDGNVLPTQFA